MWSDTPGASWSDISHHLGGDLIQWRHSPNVKMLSRCNNPAARVASATAAKAEAILCKCSGFFFLCGFSPQLRKGCSSPSYFPVHYQCRKGSPLVMLSGGEHWTVFYCILMAACLKALPVIVYKVMFDICKDVYLGQYPLCFNSTTLLFTFGVGGCFFYNVLCVFSFHCINNLSSGSLKQLPNLLYSNIIYSNLIYDSNLLYFNNDLAILVRRSLFSLWKSSLAAVFFCWFVCFLMERTHTDLQWTPGCMEVRPLFP